MSGHSKWATTKRKKWAEDAKRSAVFTKLANAITIAARRGGDPATNFALRIAVEKAKSASMPKENIEKAIKRGTGEGGGAAIEEIIYEGYGPGGVAILILCLTDNRQRTISSIRAVFNRFGGSLAEAGSVSYLFEKVGQIIIEKKSKIQSPNDKIKTQEQIEELIINSGADNFEVEGEDIIVYTALDRLQAVAKYFEDAGIKIESSEATYLPKATVEISQEKQVALNNLLEALDNLDDVSEVFSNIN